MTVTSSRPSADREYKSSYLTKGAVSLDEIRTLLLNWRPGESPADFAARVRQAGILTKQTSRRALDTVELFRVWFLSPDDRAARRLKILVEADLDRKVLSELVFLYKARSETVLYDFTIERFWPACHNGALYLRPAEVESFLQEAQEMGLTAQLWSPNTQERLAQGIMRALYEVGFLQRGPRNSREYVLYQPTDFVVAYLAYDLHLAGLADAQLAEHPDWGLFGLEREQVLNRLDTLDERAGLIVQRAGSVVRITWSYATMQEVIDAFTR